jgi:hypothetical protein
MPALAGALASGVGAAGGVADALALRRLPPELDALRIWLAVEPGAFDIERAVGKVEPFERGAQPREMATELQEDQ